MTLPRKDLFHLPDGVIYLDGNSLGPLPVGVAQRVATTVRDEWGTDLIRAWNARGWMDQPRRMGNRIARLIGAPEGSVMVGDTLSLKVFQALSAALDRVPDRRVILSDTGNFPSDLYMADGLIALKDQGHHLRVVAPEAVTSELDETVAAVLLTQVDYRTGARHDLTKITQATHDVGAVMVWDLAHSAGAIDVDLTASGCDFAVGCTYKYLNGGPGAPAFIYVRPDLVDAVTPALSGWLGHQAPFDFERGYQPARGVDRMRVGTPPVVQMAALDAALDVWDSVNLPELWAASAALSERFIARVETACPALRLVSPRHPDLRGSHVSFAFDHAYPTMQALIDQGVIGDFRAPDILRFGITPLYLDETDIDRAVDTLQGVLDHRLWDRPRFATRKPVT
ncbi:MAG: kynureninase [Pseudomonadota bacterium]